MNTYYQVQISPLKWQYKSNSLGSCSAEVPFGKYYIIAPLRLTYPWEWYFDVGHGLQECKLTEHIVETDVMARIAAETHWQDLVSQCLIINNKTNNFTPMEGGQ
jgi:hypothetical protein